MYFLYAKALHIIFIVTWFAGLFYIVRLFIYHTEAQNKDTLEKEVLSKQFSIMESRLWYGITWPSAILVLITALFMLYSQPSFLKQSFMQVKLAFVSALYLYHLYIQKLMNEIKRGVFKLSSFRLRLFNELATVFLIAIVFIIILRDYIGWVWGVVGVFGIAFLLWGAIHLFRKQQSRRNDKANVKD